MIQRKLDWALARLGRADSTPENWFPAHVPGAVQRDYALWQNWPSFFEGLHAQDYAALEDDFWLYRAPLYFELDAAQTAVLVFQGIDYQYQIRVGGEVLSAGEGMFHTVRVDVSRFSGTHTNVEVLIAPSPKSDASGTRSQARFSCKPAACYGWDWHPRLLTSGIWDDAYLQIEDQHCIQNFDVSYQLSDDLTVCTLQAGIQTGAECRLRLRLFDEETCVAEQTVLTKHCFAGCQLQLNAPKLWYPRGYGAQPLYTLQAETLDDADCCLEMARRRLGLRRAKLVMNEGGWVLPGMPKSRSDAPATLEVNGIRLFAKGSNWVNACVFPGEMDRAVYEQLLSQVEDANMNLIRVWGGGFVNKESFYELCDEKGLMVWQEFPLACNEYPDDPAYLAVLEQEAVSILRRLRTHPCVCIWCGGNELFNGWSGMTEQHHALRLLDSLCYREDRFTPFIMTSPLNGMAHGHYLNYDPLAGAEFITTLNKSWNTAYTEFGSPSMADYEDLKQFMSPADVEDCAPGNPVWELHHGFRSWRTVEWLCRTDAEYYFGGFRNTEDLCRKTQFIQSMSYRSNFEEARRQWPHCAMALNWCFNEPWPAVSNNSLICWNGRPKPAYYAVKQALRPTIVSLAVTRHLWWDGETFEGKVWVLNDSLQPLPSIKVQIYFRIDGDERYWGSMDAPAVSAQENILCGGVCFRLPENWSGQIHIRLAVEDRSDMDSEYVYLCRQRNAVSTAGMLNV